MTEQNTSPSLQVNGSPFESESHDTIVSDQGFCAKEKEHLTFKLDKLSDKKLRFEQHECFLNKCLNNNITPNGLRVHVEPSIGNRDDAFLNQWHARLDEFSRTLTSDVVGFCEKEIAKTKEEIEITTKKLKDLTSTEEFKDITGVIANNQTFREKDLQQKKNRKFYGLKYRNNNIERRYNPEDRWDNTGQRRYTPQWENDKRNEYNQGHQRFGPQGDRDRNNNRSSDRSQDHASRNSQDGWGKTNYRQDDEQRNQGNQNNRRDSTVPGVSYANTVSNENPRGFIQNGRFVKRPSYRDVNQNIAGPSSNNQHVPLSERISIHRRNSKRNMNPNEINHQPNKTKDQQIEDLRRRLNQLESDDNTTEKVITRQVLEQDNPPKNTQAAQRKEMGKNNPTDITEMKSFLGGVMETIKEFDKRLTNQLNTSPIHSER